MKCNCISDIENKVLDKLTNDKAGLVNSVKMQNMGLSFDDPENGWRTSQPIEYEFRPLKKDGSYGKVAKKTVEMYHTFCPFCGVKKYD
jgi:hypothetical protein